MAVQRQPLSVDETEAPLFRLPVEPNERNGLRMACRLMVDKITTVPNTKVGARVGRLDDEDILRLNQAVLVFLGLVVSPKTKQAAAIAAIISARSRSARGCRPRGPHHRFEKQSALDADRRGQRKASYARRSQFC